MNIAEPAKSKGVGKVSNAQHLLVDQPHGRAGDKVGALASFDRPLVQPGHPGRLAVGVVDEQNVLELVLPR